MDIFEQDVGKHILVDRDGKILEAKILELSPSRNYAKLEFDGTEITEWVGCAFGYANIIEMLA